MATYGDGLGLVESSDGSLGARMEDIETSRLARFGLVNAATLREVVGFDVRTGVFQAHGKALEFLLDGEPLGGRPGLRYDRLVQYKAAHADCPPAGGVGASVVDRHHIGYRVHLDGCEGRVEVGADARWGFLQVEAAVRGPPGAREPRVGVRYAGLDVPLGNRGLLFVP